MGSYKKVKLVTKYEGADDLSYKTTRRQAGAGFSKLTSKPKQHLLFLRECYGGHGFAGIAFPKIAIRMPKVSLFFV